MILQKKVENVNIRFQTPHQYVFIHRNVKHLLLLWKKEHKRDLYIIEEEDEEGITLRFPGQTYVDMVLNEIEPIFFQTLETESETFRAILLATFEYQDRLIALYAHPHRPQEECYFFEVKNETIHELSEHEYQDVVQTFMDEYPEFFKN